MERTPRLIRLALAALPSAPDPRIIVPAQGGRSGSGDVGRAVGSAGRSAYEDGGHGHGSAGGQGGGDGEAQGQAEGAPGAEGQRGIQESISYQPTGGGGKAGGGKGPAKGAAEAKGIGGRGLRSESPSLSRAGRALSPAPSSICDQTQTEYNPYLDLLLFKKPHTSFYNHAWETKPLKLHDKHLVSAKRFTCGENLVGAHTTTSAVLDVSDEISGILSSHPGPVAQFRVDTSKWRDQSVLVRWLQMLLNKSVQEITVLNLGHKTSTGFPVEELQDGRLSA